MDIYLYIYIYILHIFYIYIYIYVYMICLYSCTQLRDCQGFGFIGAAPKSCQESFDSLTDLELGRPVATRALPQCNRKRCASTASARRSRSRV